jgi:hypothetical protein
VKLRIERFVVYWAFRRACGQALTQGSELTRALLVTNANTASPELLMCYIVSVTKARRAGATQAFSVSVDSG